MTTVGNDDENNNDQNLNKKWKEGEIEEWKSMTKNSCNLTFGVFLQSRLHS